MAGDGHCLRQQNAFMPVPTTDISLPTKDKHPRVRLLIADIDGTLVTKEKLLTPRSINAVQRLSDAGILFGVTTGRPPQGTRMLVDSLAGLKFIAGFNGAIVVRRDFSLFKLNLMPADAAKQVVQIIEEHKMD